jgi:glycine cleavage system H protein
MAGNVSKNGFYTKAHEWAMVDSADNTLLIGISDFAQHSLGDIVFIDVQDTGTSLSKGDSFGTVESVKAAEDLYAPVSGTISAINTALKDSPESINKDPYGSWIIRLKEYNKEELNQLMDAAAYEEYLKTLE